MAGLRVNAVWGLGLVLFGCPGKEHACEVADDEPAVLYPDAVYFGDEVDEFAGATVSSEGDINGDGFADVLVDAYHHRGAQVVVAFFYGSPHPESRAMGEADVSFSDSEALSGVKSSAAYVGDVNGDGVDDALVGLYFQGATLILGSANLGDLGFGGDAPVFTADYLVSVSGAGDMTGDGLPDMLVAASDVYLVPGGEHLGQAALNDGAIQMASEPGFQLSRQSLAGPGDVDGDGLADAMMSAYDTVGGLMAGYSYLVLGGDRLAEVSLTDADVRIATTAGMLVCATSAGDVNADGHADILIASDGLYLFLGAQAPDWRALDQADSAVPEFDRSGCALGVGDVDGDGFDDVAVSGGGDTAWLAYGAASGVDLERGSRPVIEVPEGLGAIIGGGGDVNADGLDDWLVSSPYSDWDDVEGAGVAYLLLGAPR